jgi:23S rRNA (guanosine2251-2'-O)-methyltransferase
VPRSKPRPAKARFSQRSKERADPDRVVLYGLHAIEAALRNPKRQVYKVFATENAAHRLEAALSNQRAAVESASPKDLDRLLHRLGIGDPVHQGVILETSPLPPVGIGEIAAEGVLIVLDQVTDPQNVGAVLRSAAAFGATGLMMPARHSPPLAGALAKAASGALETVPILLVGNLAQALSELGEAGFFRVGLAEETEETLERTALTSPLALVFGAEGKGLRQLTRERCDQLCRIATRNEMQSLNISNAAAIALHWVSIALQSR